MKKKKKLRNILNLEYILGIINDSQICLSPINEDLLFYAAGNRIVLYSISIQKQLRFYEVDSYGVRSFSCLDVSADGKYIIAGEKSGPLLSIYIWRIEDGKLIEEIKGHKFGINHVIFSKIYNEKQYILSMGNDQDRTLKLWRFKPEYRNENNKSCVELLASKRIPTSLGVVDIAFAPHNSYFVTAGDNSFRIWNIIDDSKTTGAILQPINASLGPCSKQMFVAAVANDRYCYGVTKKGSLCMFVHRPQKKIKWELIKWVDLIIDEGITMTIFENILVIGAANGTIRLFDGNTLSHLGSIAEAPPNELVQTYPKLPTNDQTFPNVMNLSIINNRLATFYSNRTIAIWDVSNRSKAKQIQIILNHSNSIWSVTSIDHPFGADSTLIATGASDGTIRIWSYPQISENVPSSYLSSCLYSSNSLSIRSLKSTLSILIAGTSDGYLDIYSLPDFHLLNKIEAHKSEILTLSTLNNWLLTGSRDRSVKLYNINNPKDIKLITTSTEHSGVINSVDFISRLDDNDDNNKDHSKATPRNIKARTLTSENNEHSIVTCSADQSIIFSEISQSLTSMKLKKFKQLTMRCNIHTVLTHPTNKFILCASSDKQLHIFTRDGNELRTYPTKSDVCKAVLDPSGTFIAVAFTDRTISIFDWLTGQCLTTVCGHAQAITGLHFINNGRYLISVSADGCILYWRLGKSLVKGINRRLKELNIYIPSSSSLSDDTSTSLVRSSSMDIVADLNAQPPSPPPPSMDLNSVLDVNTEVKAPESPIFVSKSGMQKLKFSDNNLPSWARSTLNPPTLNTPNLNDTVDEQSTPIIKNSNAPISPKSKQLIEDDDVDEDVALPPNSSKLPEPWVGANHVLATSLEVDDSVVFSESDDDINPEESIEIKANANEENKSSIIIDSLDQKKPPSLQQQQGTNVNIDTSQKEESHSLSIDRNQKIDDSTDTPRTPTKEEVIKLSAHTELSTPKRSTNADALKLEDVEESIFTNNTADRELIAMLGLSKSKILPTDIAPNNDNSSSESTSKITTETPATTSANNSSDDATKLKVQNESKEQGNTPTQSTNMNDQKEINWSVKVIEAISGLKIALGDMVDLIEKARLDGSGAKASELEQLYTEMRNAKSLINTTLGSSNDIDYKKLLETYSKELISIIKK